MIFTWIVTKIKNQFTKLDKLIYSNRLKRLKKTFKYCGLDVFIQFPVRIEGASNVSLGNNVSINAFVHLWGQGNIRIGDDCLIASHVSITSLTHDPEAALYRTSHIAKDVNIGNNVWIGSHAVILPGVNIGDNAIVGAGAVVNKDVPQNAIVAGIPAKVLRIKK